jgi:hypothetical protein
MRFKAKYLKKFTFNALKNEYQRNKSDFSCIKAKLFVSLPKNRKI